MEGNYFTNVARSRITKQEARDYVYTFMHPEETEEYRLVTAAQAVGEEQLDDDSEDDDECQWKLYN